MCEVSAKATKSLELSSSCYFIYSTSRLHRQESTAVASTSKTSSEPSIPLPSPFEPALTLPRTHNHHVATLHLRANGPGETLENLQIFCDFALRAGYALGIPLSKPASLPTRTSLWTVPKGPFVHKKSQENFQRRVHKRVIKVWDSEVKVVEKWLHFLRIHCMNGIGMRVEVYRHFPLSIGSTLLAASTSQLRAVTEEVTRDSDNATIRASDPESSQVMKMARAIIDQEVAKQDAEDAALRQQIVEPQVNLSKSQQDNVSESKDSNLAESSSKEDIGETEDAGKSDLEAKVAGTKDGEAKVEKVKE